MELKNCPICGSEAKIGTSADVFAAVVRKCGHAAIDIRCTNKECGCEYWLYGHHHKTQNYEIAVEMITEKWNRRAGNE